MDRAPLDALLSMPERNRFLRGMTVWVGFTQTAVTYRREARAGGQTKFTPRKMLRFAFDAITTFSHAPLQAATLLGFAFSILAFLAIPLDGRRALRGHLHARRADDDRDHPAARRDPADHGRDHRRVRRAHLRRGQAPAALRRARPRQRRGAGPVGARRHDVRIAVLGAGVCGLVAAHRLARAGHAVDVYERWPGLGGQAATLDVGDGHRLERYYHHLFTSDRHIAALFAELGMPDAIEWRPSSVAFFARGALHPFVTPLDLLRFRPLSPLARVRMGARGARAAALRRRPRAVRADHRARVDRAAHGPPGVGGGLGAAAARQVRRARRRHRDGLAVEQAAAAPLGQGRGRAPGAARLPARLVGAAVRGARALDRAAAAAC